MGIGQYSIGEKLTLPCEARLANLDGSSTVAIRVRVLDRYSIIPWGKISGDIVRLTVHHNRNSNTCTVLYSILVQ